MKKARTEKQRQTSMYNWMIRGLMGHRWNLKVISSHYLSTDETKQIISDILKRYDDLQISMRKRNYDQIDCRS